jgi:hypothetical protein
MLATTHAAAQLHLDDLLRHCGADVDTPLEALQRGDLVAGPEVVGCLLPVLSPGPVGVKGTTPQESGDAATLPGALLPVQQARLNMARSGIKWVPGVHWINVPPGACTLRTRRAVFTRRWMYLWRVSSSTALIGRRAPSNTITGCTPWCCSSSTRDMKYVTNLARCIERCSEHEPTRSGNIKVAILVRPNAFTYLAAAAIRSSVQPAVAIDRDLLSFVLGYVNRFHNALQHRQQAVDSHAPQNALGVLDSSRIIWWRLSFVCLRDTAAGGRMNGRMLRGWCREASAA